jgi:hypothetical protein
MRPTSSMWAATFRRSLISYLDLSSFWGLSRHPAQVLKPPYGLKQTPGWQRVPAGAVRSWTKPFGGPWPVVLAAPAWEAVAPPRPFALAETAVPLRRIIAQKPIVANFLIMASR